MCWSAVSHGVFRRGHASTRPWRRKRWRTWRMWWGRTWRTECVIMASRWKVTPHRDQTFLCAFRFFIGIFTLECSSTDGWTNSYCSPFGDVDTCDWMDVCLGFHLDAIVMVCSSQASCFFTRSSSRGADMRRPGRSCADLATTTIWSSPRTIYSPRESYWPLSADANTGICSLVLHAKPNRCCKNGLSANDNPWFTISGLVRRSCAQRV